MKINKQSYEILTWLRNKLPRDSWRKEKIKYKKNNKKEAKPIKQRHILNKQTPKIKKQDFGTKIADLQV